MVEFSHILKKLVKLHQGLTIKRQVKFIDKFLSRYNEKLYISTFFSLGLVW
ncbi:MAG: hypothetical protein RL154_1017 [Pseudomonadota bacterium]|jgi:hypothetical protein